MVNEQWLKHIYQQWASNNDDVVSGYHIFVKIAAGMQSIAHDAMMEELKKYPWFIWPK